MIASPKPSRTRKAKSCHRLVAHPVLADTRLQIRKLIANGYFTPKRSANAPMGTCRKA